MTRYLVRQAVLSLVKLFIFLTLMFFFIQIMMPHDFVAQFSLGCDAACRAAMRAQLGLDRPLSERYFHWLGQIVTLDLGNSFRGGPILDILMQVAPSTILIFVIGTVVAFIIGQWLGKITAWWGRGPLSRSITLVGIVLFTSFPPWLAWLVSYVITRGSEFVVMGEIGGLRGVSLRGLLSRELWEGSELTPQALITRMILSLLVSALFFVVLNALLKRLTRHSIPGSLVLLLIGLSTVGSWYALAMEQRVFDIWSVAWLPLLTYILLSFGETLIIMQSSMTEVLKEEYINTAHAKGLPASVVREKHAARNAMLPALSRLVISLPYLITGVVIIESSLRWPGMGTTMWNALYWQDMPLVMNTLLLVGVLSLVARLALDVIIAYQDPRIRYDQREAARS